MQEAAALAAFSALSEETRLRIVRTLVRAGQEGMAAGALGVAIGGASSSRLSFHLAHLERAGLVTAQREGRFVIYAAAFPALSALIAFLVRDCCQGRPEICGAAIDTLCCP